MPKLPSSWVALSFESSLLSTFLKGSSWAALPLRRDTGHLLEEKGYEIKVLDLIDMEKSHCYNPFVYISRVIKPSVESIWDTIHNSKVNIP